MTNAFAAASRTRVLHGAEPRQQPVRADTVITDRQECIQLDDEIDQWQCQVYSGRACASPQPVDTANATPIQVVAGGTASGINFAVVSSLLFGSGFEN